MLSHDPSLEESRMQLLKSSAEPSAPRTIAARGLAREGGGAAEGVIFLLRRMPFRDIVRSQLRRAWTVGSRILQRADQPPRRRQRGPAYHRRGPAADVPLAHRDHSSRTFRGRGRVSSMSFLHVFLSAQQTEIRPARPRCIADGFFVHALQGPHSTILLLRLLPARAGAHPVVHDRNPFHPAAPSGRVRGATEPPITPRSLLCISNGSLRSAEAPRREIGDG